MRGIILVMVFSLFMGCSKHTPELDFWRWFQENESMLFDFERDQKRTFHQLRTALKKVNPHLTFEFGPKQDGKREFVISAGGLKAAFPAVESLYSAAPNLDRWLFVKFRQRQYPLYDIEYSNKTIKVADVRFSLSKDDNPNKVGIIIFMPGYNEAEKTVYDHIAYLMLDEALGEYDVETRVGFIEVQGHDSRYFPGSLPLDELGSRFDEVIKNKR
jgi:hypothetical protein